jgi:predicted ArsR family transcriptional regulator
VTGTAARVMEVVRRGGATAAQVAEALGISKPTAYKYLEELRARSKVVTRRERVSARGPRSKVYVMGGRK